MRWKVLSRLGWITKAATALTISAALLGVDAESGAQIPCSYEIAAIIEGPDCGILGQASAVGTGISPNGEYVCGYFTCPGGNDVAFLYTVKTGEVTTIPFSQGFYSMIANDVNDNAIVVGTGQKTNIGLRGFVHYAATGQTLELSAQNPNEGWSQATAINSEGVICGFRSLDDGGDPVDPFNAFIWSGHFVDLGVMIGPRSAARSINSRGAVCGWTGTSQINGEAFVHADGKTTLLGPIPGGFSSVAFGLNTFGDVVGSGRIVVEGSSFTWPFVNTKGKMFVLPTLDGYPIGSAADIDDNRLIVGVCIQQQNPNITIGCIWRDQTVMPVASLIDSKLDVVIASASDISSSGFVLCQGTFDGEVVSFLLSPVSRSPGDANCDEQVNVDDLLLVINQWGPCFSCMTDFDVSGNVDIADLWAVIQNWSSY